MARTIPQTTTAPETNNPPTVVVEDTGFVATENVVLVRDDPSSTPPLETFNADIDTIT